MGTRTVPAAVAVPLAPSAAPVRRPVGVARAVSRLGAWSAVLSAIFSAGWFISMVVQNLIAPVPAWQGTAAYLADFTPLHFLMLYPSLLLALTVLVLLACIHEYAADGQKVWSLIALAVGIVYATMASINYTIQVVAVRQSLLSGETEGLAMFLQANPHSIFIALANSYVYMCLAMAAATPVFQGGRLERWIRWLLLAQGLVALTQIGWSMFDLSLTIFAVTSIVIWVIGAPVVFVLLAVLFRRTERAGAPSQPAAAGASG